MYGVRRIFFFFSFCVRQEKEFPGRGCMYPDLSYAACTTAGKNNKNSLCNAYLRFGRKRKI